MRSGVPDYNDTSLASWSVNFSNIYKDITPLEFITTWTPKSFLFPPGSGGSYSSNGYILAGLTLAAVNNKTWDTWDQRSILPSALAPTVPGFKFSGRGPCFLHPNVTSQYYGTAVPVSSYWLDIVFFDIIFSSCLNGWTMGNLAAAPGDVSRVLYNVLSPSAPMPLLSANSLQQMNNVRPLTIGWSEGLQYGLGLMHVDLFPTDPTDDKYTTMVGHAGQDYGSGAPIHYYNRELDASVVIATNSLYGMNCSIAHLADNAQFATDTACHVWSEVMYALTNGSSGRLDCTMRTRSSVVSISGLPNATPLAPRAAKHHSVRRTEVLLVDIPPIRLSSALGDSPDGMAFTPLTSALGDTPMPLHCPAGGAAVCTGSSATLSSGDCYAWKVLHSVTTGSGWSRCSTDFADPCACRDVMCAFVAGSQRITAFNLSRAGLRGYLPQELRYLSALTMLDVSANQLYGQLPDLPFYNLTHRCSVAGNAFDCPLPASASSCHRTDQPAPQCFDPNMPPVSAACASAVRALDASVAPYLNASGSISNAIIRAIAPQCSNELQMNHTCHMRVNWLGTSSDISKFVRAYNASITVADPTARLCATMIMMVTECLGVGECKYFIQDSQLIPIPGVCLNAADMGKYLAWAGNAQHCAQMNAVNCTVSLASDFPCSRTVVARTGG